MRPLNGKCAMTKEEKKARLKELNKNQFHRALHLKSRKAWRDAHKDDLNARRRKSYAENKDKCVERSRRWRSENPEKAKAAWKKWADKNREYLRERDRVRRLDPKRAERNRELRKIRESSPEVQANVRRSRRAWYHKNKNGSKGLRWTMKFLWIPKWESLEREGPEAEEKYLKRCFEKTRMYYRLWKSGSPIIDRIMKGGNA